MENHNYRNINQLEEKMRSYQSIPYALIGGGLMSLLAACLWAFVVVGSGYQIGLMAIVVGMIVGWSVLYFGAGYDPVFSAIGGVYALLSCLLGNLFSQIGFSMTEEGLSLMQVLSFLNLGAIIEIIKESFAGIDLLFYGIAVYEGIRFSRRTIEPNTDPKLSLEPPLSSLRAPLVGTISIALLASLVYFGLQKPTVATYFHETGEKMSVGAYKAGVEHGDWEYFYTNGQTESKGTYENGKQIGEWNIYYNNGQLESKSNFLDGLQTGQSHSYYMNGNPLAINTYRNGRLNGLSEVYHESGDLGNRGEYINDREVGEWTYYYENGNKSASGKYENGEYVGKWEYWYESGELLEILDHKTTNNFKIIEAYDLNGKQIVKNGNGKYVYYHENGKISSRGEVKDGEKVSAWTVYDESGKLTEEGYYENDVYFIKNSWNLKSQHVKDGNGHYEIFSDLTGNLVQSGEMTNGLKSGKWIFYYDSLQIPAMESFFVDGKVEGEIVQYFESGNIFIRGEYKNDVPDGKTTWYDDYGNKTSEAIFINGIKDGVQSFWNGAGVLTKEEVYDKGELIETR